MEEVIKNFKPNIKAQTIKNYVSNLKNLSAFTDYQSQDDIAQAVEKKTNKLSSQKTLLTSAIVYLQALGKDTDKLQIILKEKQNIFNKLKRDQVYTETQKKNLISYSDIFQVLDMLEFRAKQNNFFNKKRSIENIEIYQAYVVLLLFLHYPHRNSHATFTFSKKQNEDPNQIVYNRSNIKYILTDYKTSKTYGKIELDITDKHLKKVFQIWFKLKGGSGRLFDIKDYSTYIKGIFSSYLNKKVGTTLLRSIIISEVYKDRPSIQEEEKEEGEIITRFLHSKNIQKLYYQKYNIC